MKAALRGEAQRSPASKTETGQRDATRRRGDAALETAPGVEGTFGARKLSGTPCKTRSWILDKQTEQEPHTQNGPRASDASGHLRRRRLQEDAGSSMQHNGDLGPQSDTGNQAEGRKTLQALSKKTPPHHPALNRNPTPLMLTARSFPTRPRCLPAKAARKPLESSF